jgi:hypothetical protein
MRTLVVLITMSMLAFLLPCAMAESASREEFFPIHGDAGQSRLVVHYQENWYASKARVLENLKARELEPGVSRMSVRELLPPLLVYWDSNLFAIDPDLMQDQVLVRPQNRNRNPDTGLRPLQFYQGDSETSATMTRLVQEVREMHAKPGEDVFPYTTDDFVEIVWRGENGVEEYSLPANEVRAFFANEQSPYEELLTDRHRRYSAAFMDVLLEVIRLEDSGKWLPPGKILQEDIVSPPVDDRAD